MPELELSYKGYSLVLYFPKRFYYVITEFEPGKTMYQILFEHLVDGKAVSQGEFARRYKHVNYSITDASIARLLKGIEFAVKNSPDKRLKKMRFVRLARGGASPVVSRQSPKSRFTQAQREVIDATIRQINSKGRPLLVDNIRKACLKALAKNGLAENVSLKPEAIKRAAGRLNLKLKILSHGGARRRRL